MRSWSLVAFALLVLPGCVQEGGGAGSQDDDPTHELELSSTDTTGIIRGVVVDEAVRPLAGVEVSLTGQDVARTTTSTDSGAFGFQGLPPGTYFVLADKPGYVGVQQNAEVVAGEDEPPLVRFQLVVDPEERPFFDAYVFEGYIQCSFSLVAVGFAACSTLGSASTDNFDVTYALSKTPDWLQSEMVWDSTQAASDGLGMSYSASGDGALLTNWANAGGPSPVTIQTNRSLNEEWDIGNGTDLYIRIFNEPIAGTRPSDPVNGDDCVDRPVLSGCATGVGLTLQQQFNIYTHAFFGYAPDPAWRFSDAGMVPPA